MRVLHIGEYVQGGVATYVSTLLNHPDYPEIEDYLICSDKNSEKQWSLSSNHIQYYHYHRSLTQIPVAMRAIYKAIKVLKPDVIYCHSTWAGLFARLPMLLTKKPCRVIYNAHGWSFLRDTTEWKRRIYALIESILQKCTDVIVNVSRYEYESALQYGLKSDNQIVIYSGISSQKGQIDSNVKLPETKINLLFVGRFDPQKGLDILLKAFRDCNRNDLHLTIIGDNVIGGGQTIQKKNTDYITFLGWVPHSKLASYYNACDLVVMPSRWEAFGLVAVEAMKYGKPVIASDRGALPELIHDGCNGKIFEMENPNSLCNVLKNITKKDAREMGKAAKSVFEQNYQASTMIKQTIALMISKMPKNN